MTVFALADGWLDRSLSDRPALWDFLPVEVDLVLLASIVNRNWKVVMLMIAVREFSRRFSCSGALVMLFRDSEGSLTFLYVQCTCEINASVKLGSQISSYLLPYPDLLQDLSRL